MSEEKSPPTFHDVDLGTPPPTNHVELVHSHNFNTIDKNEPPTKSTFQHIIDILLCRGDTAVEEFDSQPVGFRELFRFATTNDVLCFVFGSIFAGFGGIIQPFVFIFGGYITAVFLEQGEKVGNDEFVGEVRVLILWMAVSGLGALLTTFLQCRLLNYGCTSIVSKIRRQFLAAVLRQEASWFDSVNSGAITTQLNENIDRIEDGLGDKIGLLVRGFSMFISSIGVCVVINWKLTLITLVMGPMGAMILAVMAKVVAGYSAKMLQTSSNSGEIAEEAIMNVKTVAACNAQQHMVEKYSKILQGGQKDAIRYHFWVGFFEGLAFMDIYIVMAVAFWSGINGFYDGSVTRAGDVLLVVGTVSLTAYYLGLLGPHMMAILKARVAAAVIYETIDRKPVSARNANDLKRDIEGEVSFEDVHFHYPTRPNQPILQGLTWNAKKGETVALVGHSGCGKSTSIGLLTRLYEQIGGSVTIDGHSIDKYDLKQLRKSIAVVQQEPCLFNGTVLDNICLGREEITEETAQKAAASAEAHEFIEKLEKGYHTVLGSGGVSLSGGQKQRIAIARAIASDPEILLLDEATSALDTESERIVQAALQKASIGRTTVIIAHRLSTLIDVDRIYVINQGRVVECGSHHELLANNGFYATLARAQEVQTGKQPHFSKNQHVAARKPSYTMEDEPFSRSFSARASSRIRKMKEEGTTHSENQNRADNGLLLIYRNMGSDMTKFVLAILVSFVRGSELPCLGFIYYLVFVSLQQTPETYQSSAFWAIATCLIVGAIVWISLTAQFTISGWTAESVVNRLKIRAIRSLLHRNIEEFDVTDSSPAACVTTLTQHAPNCRSALDHSLVMSTGSMFAVICGLIISFVFSWQIGLLGTVLCTMLFILVLTNIRLSYIARAKKEREDRSAEFAIQMVEQVKTIQLMAVEDYFLEGYEQQQLKSTKYDRLIGFVDSANFAATQSFVFFSDLLGYALATYLIYTGWDNVEHTYLSFIGAQFAGWSVMYAAPFFPELIRASGSAKEIFSLIDQEEKINRSLTEGATPDITGSVIVESVTFSYPTRKAALVSNKLSIHAERGEKIALVGSSGCGKSTIVNLLERFYETNKGNIKLDSHNIGSISLKHLRANVALVGQEPVLFKGSILENITMGAGEVSMEDVISSCKIANAAKFIESFPLGYMTDVGEKGGQLSGGQKQRIAIARALVRNPRLLLLDEATSALDTESEKVVQLALEEASSGRTSITIAHRLSSIQNSDRIYFIEDGSVIECGTHSELIELDGKYAKLVRAQQLTSCD